MIDINLVWIISLILIVLLAIIFVLNGYFSYKKTNNNSFSFLNQFPHEMSSKEDPNRRKFFALLIVYICSFLLILANSLPFIERFKSFLVFLIFESIFSIITAGAFVIINLIETKYIRQHSLGSTIYMASTLGMIMITSIFAITLYSINKSSLTLCVGIVGMLLTLIQVVVILNPKLKDWAKLDSHLNNNGEVEYTRPKFFPLAYSEWITFIISTLSIILFLIALI